MNFEGRKRPRPLSRHATQRNHRNAAVPDQQSEPHPAERAGTEMRDRRKDGRDENQSCAAAFSRDALGNGVNWRRQRAAMQAMLPAFAASNEHQPPGPRDPLDPSEERSPFIGRHAIIPEHDARSLGQFPDPGKQRVAHPLIGHQPEPGQGSKLRAGVALGHRPSYSGPMSEDAKTRLAAVEAHIARAAKLAGRRAADVKLVAISKAHGKDAIRPLLEVGQRCFGENRVQEAQDKWPELLAEFPGTELHLVGQLQSNKAGDAVARFDMIHSVDRPSLVLALGKAQDKTGKRPRCFIQVNIGGEPQKGGCAVGDVHALIGRARTASLDLAGLMAVPPADVEAAPYFALLAKLARDNGLGGLSMGMTGDYEAAVMLGATHVRIGSALFGTRA